MVTPEKARTALRAAWMSSHPSETNIKFLVGTLPDDRMLLDFRAAKVDHLKLTREQALELADGLVEAVRQANERGIVIDTGRS